MAVVLIAAGGSAGAAPQPTVAQAQARLHRLTARADQLDQRFDQVKQELASAGRRLRLVDHQAARYQVTLRSMRAEIARIAATAYENGTATSAEALLISGDPQKILDQSSILLELSSRDRAEMNQYLAAGRQLSGAKQAARRVRAGTLALKNELAGQKRSLGRLIVQQTALLAQLSPSQQQSAGPGTTAGVGGTYTGPTSTQAEKAVAFAYAQLGKPYLWGATGPGSYDCSGLTMAAWAAAGISIPRDSYGQWGGLPHVSTAQLQPGDILVFDGVGHVGLYVGGGYLIDAPHFGAVVEKVALSGWYSQTLVGAVRP
jgi:peptidoglycan DL-endopeptidase CwlO